MGGLLGNRSLRVCPALGDESYMLVIQQLSNNLVRGCASSLLLDRGENFLQSREYQAGDPTSSIDWKASARSRQLIIKEHESRRQTIVSLVVDRSGSMTTGSAETSKYAAASILAGGLSYAALKMGSPVSIVLSDIGRLLPATHSSSAVSAALLAMRSFHYREQTPLSHCLHHGFDPNGKKQLIVICSDFHDQCALEEIPLLARRHEVILIRLLDAVERRMPAGGVIRAQPAEGGRARTVRRQRLSTAARDEALASVGLPTVPIDPSKPISQQLRGFLALRDLLSNS